MTISDKKRRKLEYIQRYSHDAAIQMKTSHTCGKMFAGILVVEQQFKLIEELAKICLDDS